MEVTADSLSAKLINEAKCGIFIPLMGACWQLQCPNTTCGWIFWPVVLKRRGVLKSGFLAQKLSSYFKDKSSGNTRGFAEGPA